MRLFISYSRDDKKIVEEWVVKKLRLAGHDLWFDDLLRPGDDWKQQLSNQIERSDALVYCMTPKSIASEWCRWEVAQAVGLGKRIIPVLLEAKTDLPNQLERIQYVDFTQGPTGDAVARLMGGLHMLSPAQVPTAPSEPIGNPSRVENDDGQRRLLEVAMPACTKLKTETKLKLKISLPDSPGLRAELPEVLPSGDIIQQGDVRPSNFRLHFLAQRKTGRLLPAEVCIKIVSDAFDVEAIGAQSNSCTLGQFHIVVPPNDDSRTLNFALTPKDAQEQGSASVFILVYQNERLVAETYVETQLVRSMSEHPICGNWRLQSAMLHRTTENAKSNRLLTWLDSPLQTIVIILASIVAGLSLIPVAASLGLFPTTPSDSQIASQTIAITATTSFTPNPNAAISITDVDLARGQISGTVSNTYCSNAYGIVIFVRTNQWHVQPRSDNYLVEILNNCQWSGTFNHENTPNAMAAIVVDTNVPLLTPQIVTSDCNSFRPSAVEQAANPITVHDKVCYIP